MEDVWRVGDDHLLVPLAAEEVSHRPLARGVEMDFRLVDREDVRSPLSQIKECHRHKLTNTVRLFHQRDLIVAPVKEDRHILEHVGGRVCNSADREVTLRCRARHRAAKVSSHFFKEFPDRLVTSQLLVELLQDAPQLVFVGTEVGGGQQGPDRTVRTLDHRRAPRRLEEAPPEGLKLLAARCSRMATLREPPTYRYGLVVLWVHLHHHLDPEVLTDLILGDGDLIGEESPVLV